MIEDNPSDIIFLVKKTYELKEDEILELNELYNKVFGYYIKTPRNREDFITKFTSNEKKYSFHGLMKKNNKIIGSYPVIPNKFKYFDKNLYFGLVVDTVIDKNYQGNLDNLMKLNNLVYDSLRKEKIYFVYGIANKRYYQIIKRLLQYKDICALNFFAKPVRIRKRPLFAGVFNLIIFSLNFIINTFSKNQDSTIIKKNIFQNKFEGSNEDFENFNNVKIVSNEKFKFAYKVNIERKFNIDLRNLYIFAIHPLSKNNISKVVNYCTKNFEDVELIFYPKNGIEKSSNLFNLSSFFFKDKTIVSGKILENSIIDNRIFNNENWNLNLSNFDIK